MNRNEIMQKLQDILLDTCGPEHLRTAFTEDARLLEDFGLSSVDILYLIIAAEETFQMRFENIGIRDLPTVGDVAAYIEGKLA